MDRHAGSRSSTTDEVGRALFIRLGEGKDGEETNRSRGTTFAAVLGSQSSTAPVSNAIDAAIDK